MSDPANLADILAIIAGTDALPAPAVDPVRSVIRSGDQFLIGGQTQTLPGDQTGAGAASPFLGAIVVEWGYDVEHHRAAQFHRWLQDNEAELRNVTPSGCHYWGTYAVFAQTDPSRGAYRTVWAYENLAALATPHEACGDAASRFAVLLAELNSFRDRRIGAGQSQEILQPAALARRN